MDDLSILQTVPLFHGIPEEELLHVTTCLNARKLKFEKGEFIFMEGEVAEDIGILLDGTLQIIKETYTGDRRILALLSPGELFAESFSFASRPPEHKNIFPVTVIATAPSTILKINHQRITEPCSKFCSHHATLIKNMLSILADKNIFLNQKINYLTKRTTREKLICYLSDQASLYGSASFSIPLNRQELADYLCVERSAMSAELGKLRNEGIIEFRKNTFHLLGNYRIN